MKTKLALKLAALLTLDRRLKVGTLLVLGYCCLVLSVSAQTTAFTYQGVLTENGTAANGVYDFEFTLKDAATLGNNVGLPVTANDVGVTNGQFTVTLDYGSGVFNGSLRWLAIGVRPGASAGAYTNLSPRQAIASAPYAVYSAGAAAAGLTGTLPSAALAGTYSGALNLNNAANSFSGNGANLTALNASQLTSGTVADARLSGNVALLNGTNVFVGTNRFAGVMLATNVNNQLSGNGSGLTALNASQLTSGTVADARLSANVSLLGSSIESAEITDGTIVNADINAAAAIADTKLATLSTAGKVANSATTANTGNSPNTIVLRDGSGGFTASTITASNLVGGGSGLTALNASQLASGTVSDARLSTNVALLNANQVFSASNRFAGVLVATNPLNQINGAFFGNASGLTNLNASQLTGVLPSPQLSGSYGNALTLNNAANSFTGSGAGLAGLNASQLASGTVPDARLAANVARTNQVWLMGGNSGTTPGTHYVGTKDNQPLELKVNNQRAFRVQYATNAEGESPNLIGGHAANVVSNGFVGAFIGGGGSGSSPNQAGDNFASVVGGRGNTASGSDSTAMGRYTTASGDSSTAMGAGSTASGYGSTAIGFSTTASGNNGSTAMGNATTASGESSTAIGSGTTATNNYSTAMGRLTLAGGLASTAMGHLTTASGMYSTTMGYETKASGYSSTAMGAYTEASYDHSTAMGHGTIASGESSTAMGGYSEASGHYSTAIGRATTAGGYSSAAMGTFARALHDGSFVWADDNGIFFDSTGINQFLIRASGGVGINITNPAAALDINGSIRVGSGGTVIQRIQSGQAQVVGGSATARTNLTITFPTAFTTPPKILVSAANDPNWDVDDTFAVSVRRTTTTNCVVNIMRVDLNGGWSQWLRVNWQAWE